MKYWEIIADRLSKSDGVGDEFPSLVLKEAMFLLLMLTGTVVGTSCIQTNCSPLFSSCKCRSSVFERMNVPKVSVKCSIALTSVLGVIYFERTSRIFRRKYSFSERNSPS